MKTQTPWIAALVFAGMIAHAEIKTVVEHNSSDSASAAFKFKNVPVPSKNDAATEAQFTIVDGAKDRNGGELAKLHDGRVPSGSDQPSENFFFNASTDGGRLLVDLNSTIEIKQINTYSWHSGTRGPQVYKLYASDGKAEGFNAQPKRATDPDQCGWKLVASVDTRPKEGDSGGSYGVSLSDSGGAIGSYRYLLFDLARTESADAFGNTFYSEIDVIDRKAPQIAETAAPPASEKVTIAKTFEAGDGKYQITIDSSAAPDLTDWAQKELAPVAQEWYPKLVEMLPSEGYEAPRRVTIAFKEGMGGIPAATSGSRVSCNIEWYRRNLKGEAKGAVVHELVHVIQQYGRRRRDNPNATRTPTWLSEGIPDYLRWFKYEPQTHGADITKRNINRAKYDGSYRITANFLNWAVEKYDTNLVVRLNAAARDSKYTSDLWKERTGHTVEELGDEWKKSLDEKLAAADAAKEPKK